MSRGSTPTPERARPRIAGPPRIRGLACAWLLCACDPGVPPEHRPDEVLRSELQLGDEDEVHRITLRADERERPEPSEVVVPPGAWVEFVTDDWRVHEVHFDTHGLAAEAVAFLEASDQIASPPLVDRGARFVVSFEGAPPGRYPFRIEGNGEPAYGAVVVAEPVR